MRLEFIKIAKKHNISMTFCTKEEVEVMEKNKSKFNKFATEIKKISPKTVIVDLVGGNEHICVRGYDASEDKCLYLIDDDYYRGLIGEGAKQEAGAKALGERQLSLL